jgi:hypothetical protein
VRTYDFHAIHNPSHAFDTTQRRLKKLLQIKRRKLAVDDQHVGVFGEGQAVYTPTKVTVGFKHAAGRLNQRTKASL